MSTDFKLWESVFLDFSKETNGIFAITQNPSVGYEYNYYTAKIKYIYNNNNIELSQSVCGGLDRVGSSYIRFTCNVENKGNLNISLNKRDFFDKYFFTKRVLSGNELFDKCFTIVSSDEILAKSFFSNDRVRKLFLNNSLYVFNIQTNKNITTIVLKNMEDKFYSKEELFEMFLDFKFIIGFF